MNELINQMCLLDALGYVPKKRGTAGPSGQKPGQQPSRKSGEPETETPAQEASRAPHAAERSTNAPGDAPPSAAGDARAADNTQPSLAIEQDAGNGAADDAFMDDSGRGERGTDDGGMDTKGAPPGDGLQLDNYLCFALYSATHAMHGVYKGLLKEIGLTYPQLLAMTVLWETNNVPVGAITSKLQLDTNTLTPLLKRLEAMGLLTRTRSPRDERQVFVSLTRKGRTLQKKTEHFGQNIFQATGLSLEEATDLQQKIIKLRDHLRDAGIS